MNEFKGGVSFSEFFTNFSEKEFNEISNVIFNNGQPLHPTYLTNVKKDDFTKLPSFRFKFDQRALEELIKIIYLT
jgi:hypothetical protein